MLENIFLISLTTSAVILVLLIFYPYLIKRTKAKWRYFVWLFISIRLIIPFRYEFKDAPVKLQTPDTAVVFRTEGVPFQIEEKEEYKIKGNTSENSADYAPVVDLKDLFRWIYITGVGLFLIYHLGWYIVFRTRIHKTCIKSGEVYISKEVKSPMMAGFFKPFIVLPDREITQEERKLIIKHEMTHFKRGDLWYKLLLIVANALNWFNPLVYLMRNRADRDLEYSCDDLVIKEFDKEQKKLYTKTILKFMKRSES